MRRTHLLIAAVLVILTTLVAIGAFQRQRLVEWERRAAMAEQLVELRTAQANAALGVAYRMAERADSLARSAEVRVVQVRQRVAEVRSAVIPDTCITLVAERDEIIDEALHAAEQYRAAYETQLAVAAAQELAIRDLRVALDTARAVIRAAPRQPSRWIPTVGVGPYYGVDADRMKASRGVAVTLSWRVL
jgi:hypothetical protein